MSVTHTTSARLQTCSPFVTLALSSPTEPSGVYYSRTIGEVSILSADAGSTFGNREKKMRKNFTGTVVWVDVYCLNSVL